jgi:formamidopyrimidine-DNA glycosylase
MPELPEVETMCRGLLPVLSHCITRVEYPEIPYRPIQVGPDPVQFAKRTRGRSITDVRRLAKRVLIGLDSGDTIVIQPKMAGIVLLSDPPSPQHTRVVFHLRGSSAHDRFLYWDRRGLGSVCILSEQEIEQVLGPDRIGPDALEIGASDFLQRFQNCKKEVKVALLDQQLVSGIGNLYAAEILFAAKVDPRARCCEISADRWRSIHQATRRILRQAILKEGSTLSDGTYRNAINGEGSYQNHHRVYDREGLPCPRSGRHLILRIVQAQRSTFYCPECQKS